LFGLIGITYGVGDGVTTFNLPDLRGYFVRGAGTNSDLTAAGTFGAKQEDALKSHTHSYSKTYDPGGTAARVDGSPGTRPWGQVSDNTGDASTGTSTETRPRNIAMLYCIKS
jgi:microcystin-dependent protein